MEASQVNGKCVIRKGDSRRYAYRPKKFPDYVVAEEFPGAPEGARCKYDPSKKQYRVGKHKFWLPVEDMKPPHFKCAELTQVEKIESWLEKTPEMTLKQLAQELYENGFRTPNGSC